MLILENNSNIINNKINKKYYTQQTYHKQNPTIELMVKGNLLWYKTGKVAQTMKLYKTIMRNSQQEQLYGRLHLSGGVATGI